MSRVVNIDAGVDELSDLCKRHALGISTIEPLSSGGTRIVLDTADGALALRKRLKARLIEGKVVRSGLYAARRAIPR